MNSNQRPTGRLHFSLPLLQGLLPLDMAHLGPDVVAGITLAALGIPEVMGYTKIIGTPVITGLYTLFLPVLVFALFGSSRHLVVSADSATAAMVAAALASLSFTANTPRYIELTSLIGIVTAAILLLARILRLGFLADFLSRTVLVGFLSGVGVQVAVGELYEMLGIEKGGHGFFRQLLFTLDHVRDTCPWRITELVQNSVFFRVLIPCSDARCRHPFPSFDCHRRPAWQVRRIRL
jgi:MFS superfamily sulfate permease-like transporter